MFFKKKSDKPAVQPKSDYDVGKSGTPEEIADRLHKNKPVAGYAGLLPNGVLDGAVDALKEGKPGNFQIALQHNMLILPVVTAQAVMKGATADDIKAGLGGLDADRAQSTLNAAVQYLLDRKIDTNVKLSAASTLTAAGADVTVNKDAALAKAILRVDQPVIDFLIFKGGSVDNALAGAEEARAGEYVAAIRSYKLGPENAALRAELEDLKKQYFDKTGETPRTFAPKASGNDGPKTP